MGCLFALLALISPRLALFLLWIFSDVLSRAFDSWIIPGQPVLQVGGVDAEPAQGVGGRDHGIAALVQAVDNRRPARSIRERPVDEPPVGSGFAAAPAGPAVTAAPPRNTAMSRRATHARTPWRRLALKTLTLPRAADWFAQQTCPADRAPGPGASRSHPVRCAEPSASRASGHRSRPCALTGLRRRSWERDRSSTATSNAVWAARRRVAAGGLIRRRTADRRRCRTSRP